MKVLFFDTETTGLPDFNKRARDPGQPHVVQMAASLRSGDDELDAIDEIAKPDGWEIPVEASEIHGITTGIARYKGTPESSIAKKFLGLVREADLLVAYNLRFDKFVMRCAMRRFDLIQDADDQWWKDLNCFCPMIAMTPICQLPGKFAGQHKYPKLEEAYRRAFGRELQDAHDARADVNATIELYAWLKERGNA